MWKTKSGFTLVELLVVMGVIGVLASVVTVMTIGGNIQKGNDTRRKADLEAIRTALELYYNDNGHYPPDNNSGGWCTQISNPAYFISCSSPYDPGGTTVGSVWHELVCGGYMTSIPQDPVYKGTNKDYFYQLGGAGNNKTYLLDAYMDSPTNQGPTHDRSGCAKTDPTQSAIYNYEITNP